MSKFVELDKGGTMIGPPMPKAPCPIAALAWTRFICAFSNAAKGLFDVETAGVELRPLPPILHGVEPAGVEGLPVRSIVVRSAVRGRLRALLVGLLGAGRGQLLARELLHPSTDVIGILRAGSGNLDIGHKWIFGLNAA